MFIITCVTIFANIMSGVVYGVVSDVVLNGVPNGAGAPMSLIKYQRTKIFFFEL